MKRLYAAADYGPPHVTTYEIVRDTPKMLQIRVIGGTYVQHIRKDELEYKGYRYTAAGAVEARIDSITGSIEMKQDAIERLKARRRAFADLLHGMEAS